MYIYIYMIYTLFRIGILKIFLNEIFLIFLRQNLETLWAPVKGCSCCFKKIRDESRIAQKAVEKLMLKSFQDEKFWYSKLFVEHFFAFYFLRIFFFKDIWGCDGGFLLFLLLNMEYSQHEMDTLISWRTLQYILKGRRHQHHLVLLLIGEILHQLIGSFSH